MNEQPIRREASDTFGRNVKADIELMRRMSLPDRRAENMLGMAVIAAAVATVIGVATVIFFAIL